MKILLITSGLIPYPGLQGSTFVTWSIATALQEQGEDVSVCVLGNNKYYVRPELSEPLRSRNIHLYLLPTPEDEEISSISLGGHPASELVKNYPELLYYRPLQKIVNIHQPDILFLYTARAVAATALAHDWPTRIASTVDLDHVARLERWSFSLRYGHKFTRAYASKMYRRWLRLRKMADHHTYLLSQCDLVINHAAHHTDWLQEHGVPQTVHVPLPVKDNGKNVYVKKTTNPKPPNNPPRIITIGSPRGIATLSGFPFLVNKILPALENKFGFNGFELHIIGIFEGLPVIFENKLRENKHVIIRGYVEDLAADFEYADIFLVPTPIELGFRTRIAEAFSYGSCVVAHPANQKGMPQLKHRENILFANTGKKVAQACYELINNSDLRRRLSIAARDTFENYYDSQKTCSQISRLIRSITPNRNL